MSDAVEPTPKPSRRKSDQDQEIADFNTASAQYLDTVTGDAEIAAALEGRGYGAARLTEGRTLQQTLQAAITHRQTMIGSQGTAGSGLSGAGEDARLAFKDYRETVQSIAAFTADDRKALGASGEILKDRQKFITQARAAYDNARLPAYAPTLAEFGYPANALAAARATLDTYSKADTDQNAVGGDATKATADRNAAYEELKTYMKQLKGIANVALRQRPDLLKKLNG
jgi:hypothetical protein